MLIVFQLNPPYHQNLSQTSLFYKILLQKVLAIFTMNEQEDSIDQIPNLPVPKRDSHQIKALLYKTASIQSKQVCTNICQILTPIICLIFTIMIRNVALQNLSSNNDNVYNKFPMVGFRFNDYQYLNALNGWVFDFGCNRWFLYDWQRDADYTFIGSRSGTDGMGAGMLRHVLKTNQWSCYINDTFTQPYYRSRKQTIPYFSNPHVNINQQIFSRYLYFNAMSLKNIRETTAVEKMPDGAMYFHRADEEKLIVDVKVNDERSFELHNNNGMTRINIKDPQTALQNDTYFHTYFTITQGLLTTIDTLTTSYIKQLTNQTLISGYIYMPITGNTSLFIEMLINIICTILFPLSLSLGLPVMLYNLVLEKQTKIVQMMRMNGMGMLAYWVVVVGFYAVGSLLTVGVFYAFGYYVMANTFFVVTSSLVFWVLMLGWVMCQIGMAIFLQVFITGSRAANIIGYLTAIWTNLIGATLSIALYQFPVQMPLPVMLWPTIAFNRMFYLLFINCSADHCITSFSQLSPQMYQCLIVIYLAAISFLIIGMYLTEIVPQQFGVSKSVMFPLIELKNLICKRRRKRDSEESIMMGSEEIQHSSENNEQYNSGKYCDSLAQRQKHNVQQNKFLDYALLCNNLTKIYPNGKQATTSLNLLIGNNQIFGLLGPNGAGKTTLISMLTGIIPPTIGTASIAGYSIQNQMNMVYMNMGVCPQFDILWDELTVEDHLYFYARLRGVSGKDEKIKVKETIDEISLGQFAKFKVKQLSGGMKRRLSVAISLVGDPRIVFLDQPTTGLDPQNRRKLWQLLSVCKKRRSLFLTTHMMEQAQTLCDRVGIISAGYLRTVGSKMELKRKYGKGYSLMVSVDEKGRKVGDDSGREVIEGYYYHNDSDNGFRTQLSVDNNHQLIQGNYYQPTSSQHNSQQYSQQSSSRIPSKGSVSSSPYINQINLSFSHNQFTRSHNLLHRVKQRVVTTFGEQNCQIYKEFNNTMKFYLNTTLKMTTILQKLIEIKQEKMMVGYSGNQHYSGVDFEWSIQHSSLQDVFFNVIQQFNQN